jgi:di/tricarboxylate transporter
VTVAAVLVMSRALSNAGIVDLLSGWLARLGDRMILQVGTLTALAAVASAFINNVGALAILLPVAVRMAHQSHRSPSLLLMPLAFGSLLGGLITLIGTPPNIIIASFRADTGAVPFRMFEFAPVGSIVALAGTLFVSLIGWRLLPERQSEPPEDLFHVEDYLTEVVVPEDSKWVGSPLRDLMADIKSDVLVVGLARGKHHLPAPSSFELLCADDVLIVETDSDSLEQFVEFTGFELVGNRELIKEMLSSDGARLQESVVTANSPLVGQTARTINLRRRYGVNLLAVARQGEPLRERLGSIRFRAGDVLLIQPLGDRLSNTLREMGTLPLAQRALQIITPRRLILTSAIFIAAVVMTSFALLTVEVAFVGAAVLMVIMGLLSLREAYESIDWPILILLGAMIPVGHAMEVVGGADLIAHSILAVAGQLSIVITLLVLLVGTMLLSNVINNAAAAVLMAPIALAVAQGIGTSADPFLMGVAIGASAAFLTPIGHQSNTLVMGPGGYKFGDYWRMGLPISILVVAVATPLIFYFWPAR